MWPFISQDDTYTEALLGELNRRFGAFADVMDTAKDVLEPAERVMRLDASGIREVQAIQREFEFFRAGRPLVLSLRALGVAAQADSALRRRWFKLLNRLDRIPSEDPALSGGQAIVAALVEHLKNLDPDPVHFRVHSGLEQKGGPRVLIIRNDRPVFYLPWNFLTISLPLTRAGLRASP